MVSGVNGVAGGRDLTRGYTVVHRSTADTHLWHVEEPPWVWHSMLTVGGAGRRGMLWDSRGSGQRQGFQQRHKNEMTTESVKSVRRGTGKTPKGVSRREEPSELTLENSGSLRTPAQLEEVESRSVQSELWSPEYPSTLHRLRSCLFDLCISLTPSRGRSSG